MYGQARRRFGRITLSALLVCAVGPGVARAQIKHNDFTSMNTPFSTSSASPVYISPDAAGLGSKSFFVGKTPFLNNRVNDSRATLSGNNNLAGSFSPLDGKSADSPQWKSNFPVGNNLPLKMAPSPNTRYPQLQGSLQKDSPLNKYTSSSQLKPNTPAPSTFTDAFTFHANDNGTPLEQAGRDLSLQDLNRYQFQGSFSGTPGLPVTRAGGNSGQASFSGGGVSNLTSGSTLFDASTVPSVRSGGSVSPRMITSDGTMAYGANMSGPFGMSSSASDLHLPMQHNKVASSNNGQPSTVVPQGALVPAGIYAPTSPSGKTVTVDVSEPEFIGKGVTAAPDNGR